MHPNHGSVGSSIKPVPGLAPADNAAGTRNGAAIDRRGFDSCVLFAQTGAVSGGPTTQTLDMKLQESTDGTGAGDGAWSDVDGAFIAQISAASTSARKNVNLTGVKRFVRVVEVTAFTAGASPKMLASSSVVLGGPDELPTT